MNKGAHENSSEAARKWRRWLWETAETGQPEPQTLFDDAVYQGRDLADLMGADGYATLVEWLAADPDPRDIPSMARRILKSLFPHACKCRDHAAMDHDVMDFSGANVYRSLYFSDESVTKHMQLIFRRTPELNLFECRECGDVWLQTLDQVEWMQHMLLIEPGDIMRIRAEGVWPNALDKYEDAWVHEYGIIGRNSRQLRAWQAAHNTPDAFARYGT